GKLVTSQTSKKENLLPLGLTDHALVKKDIAKDQVITIKDVNLNLPEEVIKAREYQYNLI
ncbi:homoserine dehydrogenase, partial [Candidatus Pelagibacter sp.]|nr:homoserine dehydrogenase [Candidatus Pelagibacter sp.]